MNVTLVSQPQRINSVHQPITYELSINADTSITGVVTNGGYAKITVLAAMTLSVNDTVYIHSGAYRGKHRVKEVTSSTVFTVYSSYTGSSSSVNITKIDVKYLQLYQGTGTSIKIADVRINIATTGNIIMDVSGYLRSIFKILPPSFPNDSDLIKQFNLRISGTLIGNDRFCINSTLPQSEVMSYFVTANNKILAARKAIIFVKAPKNILSILENRDSVPLDPTVTNLIYTDTYLETLIDLGDPFGFSTSEYSFICPVDPINIVFLNRESGWQNYFCGGVNTYGREINQGKTFVTSSLELKNASSGKVYDTVECINENIPKTHLPVLEELRTSIAAFVWYGDDFIPIIVQRESFTKYSTRDNLFTVKFKFKYSQELLVQSQ